MTLGEAGLPVQIVVAKDWQRRIEAETLGETVLAAFTEAVAAGMRAWSESLDHLPLRLLASDLADEARRPDAPPAAAPDVPHAGRSRDVLTVAEDVLGVMRTVRSQLDVPPPTGTGTGGAGNLRITVTAGGLQEREVEPGWATRQRPESLNRALDEALRAARDELRTHTARRGDGHDFDLLIGEALASLRQLQDQADQSRSR